MKAEENELTVKSKGMVEQNNNNLNISMKDLNDIANISPPWMRRWFGDKTSDLRNGKGGRNGNEMNVSHVL
jgi:hypothetical protein